MSVKRNAMILGGGMAMLVGYAHVLAPYDPTPSTPPTMVKLQSAAAGSPDDPFWATTLSYWPKEIIREQIQGAQPTFTSPSGTAEKDEMVRKMFMTIQSDGSPTVQPYVCPSGTAEKETVK